MNENELLIIVPGSKYFESKILFIQKIILFLYKLVRVKPLYINYEIEEEKRYSKNSRKCIYLNWSRGVSFISIFLATQKLSKEINNYRGKYKIKLLGSSLGAQIVLDTLKSFENTIEKVVLLCPVTNYINSPINKISILNIYSEFDNFSSFGNKIMNPFRKSHNLVGENVNNIIIPNFLHDDFSADREIMSGMYSGKTVTQLVNDFLI